MGDLALFGYNLFGDVIVPQVSGPVAERFTIPPFTVLDARSGDWQTRKDAWLAMGLKSEEGRDTGGNFGLGVGGERSILKGVQGHITVGTKPEVAERFEGCGTGASIFDPVLAELAYRWFTAKGATVLDPFSGGSVRGVVAGVLGRAYVGVDLREEQVAANRAQLAAIYPAAVDTVMWLCHDATEIAALSLPPCDFVFTCPPYGDLEEYSTDPRDLSVMAPAAFLAAYRRAIAGACATLRPDRFACVVVGDYRDSAGWYLNFVSATIQAFADAGLRLYNEAILVTPTGSLPMRIMRQFPAGRKLGKAHQNVLVFVKGDWKRASAWAGEI